MVENLVSAGRKSVWLFSSNNTCDILLFQLHRYIHPSIFAARCMLAVKSSQTHFVM